MALPDDLNMTDVQIARLCRKQDAEIEGLRTELSLTQAVKMVQATEIERLRAVLKEVWATTAALDRLPVELVDQIEKLVDDEQKADGKP